MIRKAKPSDLEAIVKLGIEALEIDAYEELLISPDKVRAVTKECISAAPHFVWVSEIAGEVVGVLGALVTPLMLHERSQATIVMWYCKAGGEGMKLLKEFMEWSKGRPMIKQVQYTGERRGNPKILQFMQRHYGFKDDVKFLYRNR